MTAEDIQVIRERVQLRFGYMPTDEQIKLNNSKQIAKEKFNSEVNNYFRHHKI